MLEPAGVGVLSEESGAALVGPAGERWSTPRRVDQRRRGVPQFATSLCAVDEAGPLAALVVNLASGARFSAVRGGGVVVDGGKPSGAIGAVVVVRGPLRLPAPVVGVEAVPGPGRRRAGPLCAVATGVVDAYIDCSVAPTGPWDYLGGMLVCTEAGAVLADAEGRHWSCSDHDARRTPIAAATPELLDEVLAARRSF